MRTMRRIGPLFRSLLSGFSARPRRTEGAPCRPTIESARVSMVFVGYRVE